MINRNEFLQLKIMYYLCELLGFTLNKFRANTIKFN